MTDTINARPESRWIDRSLVLTFAAFVLLTPPIILIFNAPIFLFGIPLLHLYCFAVWFLAVIAGAYLSARLNARHGRTNRGRAGDSVISPPT